MYVHAVYLRCSCVSLVAHPTLQAEALRHARTFLVHRFPTVRVQTSEHLYLVLQENALGEDITNVEEYLLNTNWYGDIRPWAATVILTSTGVPVP